ncbi:hypothetical protein Anas_11132 [Armadillidium nasatum]|uniref:Uncharacterized protein n=1 Tax=Armadillidium nasatum TaxID=96803 RepID=A0A5N5TDJ3_9CRUS|nr:hypothetical protein Anas_11132 [Armadillidium nasatum]
MYCGHLKHGNKFKPQRPSFCGVSFHKPVHAGHCPPVLNTYCPSSINSDIGGYEPPKVPGRVSAKQYIIDKEHLYRYPAVTQSN